MKITNSDFDIKPNAQCDTNKEKQINKNVLNINNNKFKLIL